METTPDESPLSGPTIQSLLDRVERDTILIDRLVSEERISEDEIKLATLRASLNKAQRMIKIRRLKSQCVEGLQRAASVIRDEIQALEMKIAEAA